MKAAAFVDAIDGVQGVIGGRILDAVDSHRLAGDQ
jgi:hypothetical protein